MKAMSVHITRDVKQYIEAGRSYYIDFGGGSAGYARYLQMQDAVKHGIRWMRGQVGRYDESRQIEQWSLGSGGFRRTHTPYWVSVDAELYHTFMQMLRGAGYAAGQKDRWYKRALSRGRKSAQVDGGWR